MKYEAIKWAKTGAVLAIINILIMLIMGLIVVGLLAAIGIAVPAEYTIGLAAVLSITGLIVIVVGAINWALGGLAYTYVSPMLKFNPKIELSIAFVVVSTIVNLLLGGAVSIVNVITGLIMAYIGVVIGIWIIKKIKMIDSPLYSL